MGKSPANATPEEVEKARRFLLNGHIELAWDAISKHCIMRAIELEEPEVSRHLNTAKIHLEYALRELDYKEE